MDHNKHKNKPKQFGATTRMSNKLIQPTSSSASIDDIPIDKDIGKDFETLMNAPISEGGHFIFKSEKDWTVDISQYSEYFTLDLKILSAAINCIPFNKLVNIDDKYFTINQLTHMQNVAEVGKNDYKVVMDCLNTTAEPINANTPPTDVELNQEVTKTQHLLNNMKNMSVGKMESNSLDNEDFEDDLDFLLSLKEPAMENTVSVACTKPTHHIDDLTTQLKQSTANKPEDLEKWLDSLIED